MTGDRVVRFHELGGPEVLVLDRIAPAPPGPGEVQIRIEAIALNRADAMFRRGSYLEKAAFPARSGFEGAGVVTAIGPGVEDFVAGDRVNVIPGAPVTQYGTAADWLTIPARHLVLQPEGLDAERAAALWMGFLTAYGALIEVCGLREGQTVLITAGNSAVGLAAMQIARAVGARPVVTVLDEALRAPMLDAGAAAVVSAAEDLGDALAALGGIDAAFDAVGGPQVAAIAGAMRPFGTLAVHGALSPEPTPFPLKIALRNSLSLRGYVYTEVTDNPEKLARAVNFARRGVAAGAISPRIDRVFSLDEIAAAHRYLESGEAFGKIVVRV